MPTPTAQMAHPVLESGWNVTVMLFSTARAAVRAESVTVSLPAGATVGELKSGLAAAYPALKALLGTAAIAINLEYALADQIIDCRDEIAVIPPVSGG
jgi:molybdopterin converting factor subunit 1